MNDARITSYALNELEGSERDKFESDLASDPRLQRDLLAACEITDALGEVTEEPSDGLEPRARERLLREIAANQEAVRARRKIIRFALPVSLAAAASIAVLLLVSGGTTTHKPAIAAASAPGPEDSRDRSLAILNHGLSGGFTAKINSKGRVFTFKGDGSLSTESIRQQPVTYETPTPAFHVKGLRVAHGQASNFDIALQNSDGTETSLMKQSIAPRVRGLFNVQMQRIGDASQAIPVAP